MTMMNSRSQWWYFAAACVFLAGFWTAGEAFGQAQNESPTATVPAPRPFDISELDGQWRPGKGQLSGRDLPRDHLATIVLSIQDGKFRTQGAGFEEAGLLRIAEPATADHVALDVVIEEGPNAGKTVPVILRLEQDRMTVCYGLIGDRPTAFDSTAENEQLLLEYARADSADGGTPGTGN
jgi:uncharacterized protein (TIGR03067 family)